MSTMINFIHQRLNVGQLISHYSTNNFNKNLLNENRDIFYQWLVGVTDGDGTFSIVRQNNSWSLTFQISQSTYNLRLLNYIKQQLGKGNINIDKIANMAHFRIRDRAVLESQIFPIFDKYPLLTTKHFYYVNFKLAYAILSDNTFQKDEQIFEIINNSPPVDYISPAWTVVNNIVSDYKSAYKVMSKSWLAGFTESEGSFYLVKKSHNRLVHAFEITQKLDEIVLIAIKYLLHIKAKVQFKKAGNYSISTTNSRSVENIIHYFKNTLKGMKSAEYRIWARSYIKHKGDYAALKKIQDRVRLMKKNNNN